MPDDTNSSGSERSGDALEPAERKRNTTQQGKKTPRQPRVPTYDETEFEADADEAGSHPTVGEKFSVETTGTEGVGTVDLSDVKVRKHYAVLISDELARPDVAEVVALEADGLSIPWPDGLTFTEAVKAWAEQSGLPALNAGNHWEMVPDGSYLIPPQPDAQALAAAYGGVSSDAHILPPGALAEDEGIHLDIPVDADELASWSQDEWKAASYAINLNRRVGEGNRAEDFLRTASAVPAVPDGFHYELVSDDVREVTRDALTGGFVSAEGADPATTVTETFAASRKTVEVGPLTIVPERYRGYNLWEAASALDDLTSEIRRHLDAVPARAAEIIGRSERYSAYLRWVAGEVEPSDASEAQAGEVDTAVVTPGTSDEAAASTGTREYLAGASEGSAQEPREYVADEDDEA